MDTPPSRRLLEPGDPAPWFVQRATSNERYHFDTVAGRYVVLCFLGSATAPHAARFARLVAEHRALFDDTRLSLFGVSIDPRDEAEGRLQPDLPGVRHVWDFDRRVSRRYGALPAQAPAPGGADVFQPLWYVLDPTLRVVARLGFASDASEVDTLAGYLATLPPVALHAGVEIAAPVLVLPRVLEPDLCRELVALYDGQGGEDSGFMREVDGRTVRVIDYGHKRRMDCGIADDALRQRLWDRFEGRVFPEILKAFQFRVTRMERFIVACYDAVQEAHFQPHRDNTTSGTAHRRFAVTVNLNADFEGGELSFPEYGPRRYRPPVGGAVVFSCSLLHAVDTVTRGRRYAFLPFLYDEAGARVRERNNDRLAPDVPRYTYEKPT